MGIFDHKRTRRPGGNSSDSGPLDQLGEEVQEAPEIESELSAIDQALGLGQPKKRDCGCW